MTRWILYAAVAIVAFVVGLLIAPKPITFSGGYQQSAFRTYYSSSDGQSLRYGCYELGSPMEAERSLNEAIAMKYLQSPDGRLTKVGVLERTLTLDGMGNRTGERVVLDDGEILWYEGPRKHQIIAASVKHAVLFETSRLWAHEGCWNVTSVEPVSHGAAEQIVGRERRERVSQLDPSGDA